MLLTNAMKEKLLGASQLYQRHFADVAGASSISVAPGRVNLIGEHVDYTGGFVLPFAIDYSTVVLGSGTLETQASSSKSGQPAQAKIRFVSSKSPDEIAQHTIDLHSLPGVRDGGSISWTTYVVGTVFQYLPDLPESSTLNLSFAIVGDVPLGSGLSSSASLEVAVARFVENILGEQVAFSSIESKASSPPEKIRALRCQKAENEWAMSPCGLMDQYISSAGQAGSFLLIDCTSLDYTETKMKQAEDTPVLVVANSNVKHDIGGGEYPVRVAQCQTALKVLNAQNFEITSLRGATVDDVESAKDAMDEVSYRRARHAVTENQRTLQAKDALEQGDWKLVGKLMTASHASMRDDYEVSCEEIDALVEIAQAHPGVYGSRLTGGGFGGCTVTLVEASHAPSLMATLTSKYKVKTGLDCFCFETKPGRGAHILSIDVLDKI